MESPKFGDLIELINQIRGKINLVVSDENAKYFIDILPLIETLETEAAKFAALYVKAPGEKRAYHKNDENFDKEVFEYLETHSFKEAEECEDSPVQGLTRQGIAKIRDRHLARELEAEKADAFAKINTTELYEPSSDNIRAAVQLVTGKSARKFELTTLKEAIRILEEKKKDAK